MATRWFVNSKRKIEILPGLVIWDSHKRTKEVSALDKQVGGDHYKKGKIQAVEFAVSNDMGFCEGSAIKYITRHKYKGGKQDILKAIHYLELLIELQYGDKKNEESTILNSTDVVEPPFSSSR